MTWLFALRRGRWGAAGLGFAAFAINLLQVEMYSRVYRHILATPQIGADFLLPPYERLDTVERYVQWAGFGALAVLMSAWAVSSATGSVRGDEESGIVTAMLAAGVGRADLLLWRFVAFVTWAATVSGAAMLGYLAGAALVHAAADIPAAVGASVALLALGVACYSIAMLVSQMANARSATFISAAVLLALLLVERLSPLMDGLRRLSWLSPFHYFDSAQPLALGGSFNIRAVEVLVGFAIGCVLLAAIAFVYRDVGEALWQAPFTFNPRTELVCWTAGMIVVASLLLEATRRIVGAGLGLPPVINGVYQFQFHSTVLEDLWLIVGELLVALFAISQVGRWAEDEAVGRLELVLASGASRTRVVLMRAVGLALSTFAIVAPAGVAIFLEAGADGVVVSPGAMLAATLLLLPLATSIGAAGAILTAWLPRASVALLAALVVTAYFLIDAIAVLGWPTWTQDLSPFHLYGQPLTQGVDGTRLAILLGVSVVGFAASAFLFRRRDLGR